MTLLCATRAEEVATITLNVKCFVKDFLLHEHIATFAGAPFVGFRILDEYLLTEVLVFCEFSWTKILLEDRLRNKVVAALDRTSCVYHFRTFSKLCFAVAFEAIGADFMPTITHLKDFFWFTGTVAAGAIVVGYWSFD